MEQKIEDVVKSVLIAIVLTVLVIGWALIGFFSGLLLMRLRGWARPLVLPLAALIVYLPLKFWAEGSELSAYAAWLAGVCGMLGVFFGFLNVIAEKKLRALDLFVMPALLLTFFSPVYLVHSFGNPIGYWRHSCVLQEEAALTPVCAVLSHAERCDHVVWSEEQKPCSEYRALHYPLNKKELFLAQALLSERLPK